MGGGPMGGGPMGGGPMMGRREQAARSSTRGTGGAELGPRGGRWGGRWGGRRRPPSTSSGGALAGMATGPGAKFFQPIVQH